MPVWALHLPPTGISVGWAAFARRTSSATSAVLPIPGSPLTKTTLPSPPTAARIRSSSRPSSLSRPTKGTGRRTDSTSSGIVGGSRIVSVKSSAGRLASASTPLWERGEERSRVSSAASASALAWRPDGVLARQRRTASTTGGGAVADSSRMRGGVLRMA